MITFTRKEDWTIQTSDGMIIKLNEERSEENLKRLTSNFQKILKSTNKRISNVDLRYRDGFAVEIDSTSNQIKNKL